MSFKIIMTTSVTRPCFILQHQTRKTKTKTKTDCFWFETGLVLKPTLSYHITCIHTGTRVFETSLPVGCELSEDVGFAGVGRMRTEQSQHRWVGGQVSHDTQLDLLKVYTKHID